MTVVTMPFGTLVQDRSYQYDMLCAFKPYPLQINSNDIWNLPLQQLKHYKIIVKTKIIITHKLKSL